MNLTELGTLADQLEAKRNERIAADKIAAALKSEESILKHTLISEMEACNLSSIGGKSCVINRSVKERVIASNWDELYQYIKEHDAFDMLHRRITDSAVLLRRDDGVEVPGVGYMEYSHITFAKART